MRALHARLSAAAALAVGAGLLGPVATATAAVPTVSVLATSVVAAPRVVSMPVTIRLSAVTTTPVTVAYTQVDGTALAGTDYTRTAGTATIPVGARAVTVSVPVAAVAYTGTAPDKSFTFSLSAPAGATAGTMSAAGVIHPNTYLAPRTGALGQAVVDAASRFAYITNLDLNRVEVLNIKTGTWGTPLPAGSRPSGLDLTPDGKQLYVANSGAQAISVIDLATKKVVRTIITPVGGFITERAYSIAIANNGHALFTTTFDGSGFGANIYDLTLATGTYKVLTAAGGFNGQTTEATRLVSSGDHSTVLGVVGDLSSGPFFLYHAADGSVLNGSKDGFNSFGALNRTGTVMLLNGSFVIDPGTGALMGTVAGSGGPAALNASGTLGYRLEEGAIGVIDVGRVLRVRGLPVPDATFLNQRGLVISPDNRILVALTEHGATIARL